jgi:hypothetical protein
MALTYRDWRKTRRIAGVAVEALIEYIPKRVPENCRHSLRGLIVLAPIIHPQNRNVAEAVCSEEVLTKRSISAPRPLSLRLLFITVCSRPVFVATVCVNRPHLDPHRR